MQRKWRKRMVLLIENAFLEHPQLDQMYQYKSPREYQKIRPKLEGCAFANFENSSGTEGEPSQKERKKSG